MEQLSLLASNLCLEDHARQSHEESGKSARHSEGKVSIPNLNSLEPRRRGLKRRNSSYLKDIAVCRMHLTVTEWAFNDLDTKIVRLTLGMKKFDGDIVERGVGFVAGDVGEVAGGVAELAVGHDEMGFGFALDGVDNVGGAEGYIDVGHVVLMEKSGFVRGDAYAEYADVIVFKDEMMMRFLGNGNGCGSLGVNRKSEQQQDRAKKRFHL